MKLPPSLIGFQLSSPSFRSPTIWLPLFLLWPFALVLALPVFLVGLVMVTIIQLGSAGRFWECCRALYAVICEFRGTLVDVEGPDSRVFVRII